MKSPPFLDQMFRCVRPPARPFGSNHRAKALNEPKRATETTARFPFDGLAEQKQNASPSSRSPADQSPKHQHNLTDGRDVTSWLDVPFLRQHVNRK